MPQVHFFEVRNERGEIVLVRADRVEHVEVVIDRLVLRTPAGAVQAMGATRATLAADMQSAGIVMIALNQSTALYTPYSQPAEPPEQTGETTPPTPPAPPPKTVRRRAAAPVDAAPALDPEA